MEGLRCFFRTRACMVCVRGQRAPLTLLSDFRATLPRSCTLLFGWAAPQICSGEPDRFLRGQAGPCLEQAALPPCDPYHCGVLIMCVEWCLALSFWCCSVSEHDGLLCLPRMRASAFDVCSDSWRPFASTPCLHIFLSNPNDTSCFTLSLHGHPSRISQWSTIKSWKYVSTGLCWISTATLRWPGARDRLASLVASRR